MISAYIVIWSTVFATLFLSGCVTTGTETVYAVVRVEEGDTLTAVADHYGVGVAEILAFNDLDEAHDIYPGQILNIPLTAPHERPRAGFFGWGTASDDESGGGGGGLLFASGKLAWPVRGEVSSPFGPRRGRYHEGIDIRAPYGTKIVASAQGVVRHAGWMKGYGKAVVVEHRNFRTLYAHCSKLAVKQGQSVRRGEVVGEVGKSGNARGVHLHFEYRDLANVPYNPLPFLKGPTILSRR